MTTELAHVINDALQEAYEESLEKYASVSSLDFVEDYFLPAFEKAGVKLILQPQEILGSLTITHGALEADGALSIYQNGEEVAFYESLDVHYVMQAFLAGKSLRCPECDMQLTIYDDGLVCENCLDTKKTV